MSDIFFIVLPILTFSLFLGIIYFGVKAGMKYSDEDSKMDDNKDSSYIVYSDYKF